MVKLLALFLLVFALAFGGVYWFNEPSKIDAMQPTVPMQTEGTCNPASQGCQARLNGSLVQLKFSGEMNPLTPFAVEVDTGNLDVDAVTLDFKMQGMNMGVNRYRLESDGEGRWHGQVVLPVCTLTRKDWIAGLEVEAQGKRWVAEFGFELSASFVSS